MPHLALAPQIPLRRADILCYRQGSPLLLVECKAIPLTSKVLQQVIAYNYYLKAPYVAVANEQELRTGWYDAEQGSYVFVDGLPAI